MGILNLASRILGKKLSPSVDNTARPRADVDLPFGARVGGLLEVPRAEFALLDDTLLHVPAAAQMQIQAVSRVRLPDMPAIEVFRFYTDCGAQRQGEGEDFLQVMQMGGAVLDVTYYQFFCRVLPQTAEEQAPFLGKGYGLGELDYWLAADMLAAGGVAAQRAETLLGGEDALHYLRDTAGGDYVAPYSGTETRIDDAYGETGLKQQVWFMPYARTLPGNHSESLLITFEAQDSFDGNTKPAVHIDYMVGLSLPAAKIKVLG